MPQTFFHYVVVSLLILVSFAQCVQTKETFDWQAHRGFRGNMPENTVAAMLYALDHPLVQTLELDVVISEDKQVVLSHEPWFSHEITTTPDGKHITESEETQFNLYRMSMDSIRKYDVGVKAHPRFQSQQKMGAQKPTLAEVFAATQQHPRGKQICYNIEIKSRPEHDIIFTPPVSEFCRLVMDQIEKAGLAASCNIQSFDVRTLQYMRAHYPTMRLAYLVENTDGFARNMEKLGFIPEIYSPNYALVTPEVVRDCHSRYMKIIPWTVNQKAIAQPLIAMGVDGIITDYSEIIPKSPKNGSK